MTVRVLRAHAHRAMPWKNGLGTTHEVARSPTSGLVGGIEFDWRISLAAVASDGPFSRFPGCTRHIAVIDGAGMALHFADGETQQLGLFVPARFSGDRAVSGHLLAGPVRDLNVMVRTASWVAELNIAGLDAVPTVTARTDPAMADENLFVIVLRGAVDIDGAPSLGVADVVHAQATALPPLTASAGAETPLLAIARLWRR